MNKPRATDMSLPLAVLVLGAILVSGPALGAEGPGVTVELETADQVGGAPLPVVSRAVYEVHVWGGMAAGRLTLEFVNEQETQSRVIHKMNVLGIDVLGIATETAGALTELQMEEAASDPKQSRRDPRTPQRVQPASRVDDVGRAGDTPTPATVRTEPFLFGAQETTLVHANVRWRIPLEGRVFRLSLPAIRPTREVPVGSGAIPVQVSIVVHHDRKLDMVQSDSHQVLIDFVGDRTIIEPVEREIPGDRPFELRFAVNDRESPTVTGYHLDDGAGRHGVEAVINPPETPGDENVRPKQLLFIVDSSGSMNSEQKLDQARRAVLSCVEKLNESDRFNITEFDHRYRLMSPQPVDPSSFGTDRVREWLETLEADGTTEILEALGATLEQPEDSERHRMIVVVTDGIISDDEEALALLREKLGEARLFAIGTGRNQRQETLLRLAEYGRGAAVFAGDPSALEKAVEELYASISKPLGWNVEIDLDSTDVEEILPSRLPDLYAGRPVRIIAWVNGNLPSRMTLRMSTVDGDRLYTVLLPPLGD